jgi:hypothetical protein
VIAFEPLLSDGSPVGHVTLSRDLAQYVEMRHDWDNIWTVIHCFSTEMPPTVHPVGVHPGAGGKPHQEWALEGRHYKL